MTDTQPTHLDLDTIQARANAATPGPWDYFDGDDYADIAADYHQTGRGSYTCRQGIARIEADSFFDDPAHEDADEDDAADQMRSNAAFIVAARTDVPALIARIRDLEAERERRRARLVAFQNDALDMRGSLSPNGQDPKVPFELGETLTPAVDWLINRVAELEQQQADNESGTEVLQTRLWLIEQYLRTTPHHTVARDLTTLVDGAIDPASIDDYRAWLAATDLDTTLAPAPVRGDR